MEFPTLKTRKVLENMRFSTFSTTFLGGKLVESVVWNVEMWKS